MRNLTLLTLLAWLWGACAHQPAGPTTVSNLPFLFQSWTHSFEEETPGEDTQIFRPSDFKPFPVTRFRMQYVFRADGTCEWLVLDPADAHYMTRGTWKLAPASEVWIYDARGQRVKSVSFQIVQLEANRLRIRRLYE